MITLEDAIHIQSTLIERFGGMNGLRDKKLLESALMRPYQTFDNTDLYPSPSEKATAIIESILINHPFIDGNKRFGFVAMRLILMNNNQDIQASENNKYNFVINIAKGEFKYDQILEWINKQLVSITS